MKVVYLVLLLYLIFIKKITLQLRTFFGDQKTTDFLAIFLYRPFYIERASDELWHHFYLKLPILYAQFLLILIKINKAYRLSYNLEFFCYLTISPNLSRD